MAYIEEFFKAPGDSSSRHSTCSCGWRAAEREGRKVVQLDTYGSGERKIPGKVSQSIQLDEAGARDLMRILVEVFPSLRHL